MMIIRNQKRLYYYFHSQLPRADHHVSSN